MGFDPTLPFAIKTREKTTDFTRVAWWSEREKEVRNASSLSTVDLDERNMSKLSLIFLFLFFFYRKKEIYGNPIPSTCLMYFLSLVNQSEKTADVRIASPIIEKHADPAKRKTRALKCYVNLFVGIVNFINCYFYSSFSSYQWAELVCCFLMNSASRIQSLKKAISLCQMNEPYTN